MNNDADQYLMPIPRLISTPRENFLFVFEGLARHKVCIQKSLGFRDPEYILGLRQTRWLPHMNPRL